MTIIVETSTTPNISATRTGSMWTHNSAALSPPPAFEAWMTQPYHLAKALAKCCSTVSVKLLSQCLGSPFPDETNPLNSTQTHDHFLRKVFLQSDAVPVCYGRIVAPPVTLTAYHEALHTLGNRLLGQTLLYCNPATTRSTFEYGCITPDHALHAELQACNTDIPTTIFGRRSVFYLDGRYPLLVTELFLPTMPAFCE